MISKQLINQLANYEIGSFYKYVVRNPLVGREQDVLPEPFESLVGRDSEARRAFIRGLSLQKEFRSVEYTDLSTPFGYIPSHEVFKEVMKINSHDKPVFSTLIRSIASNFNAFMQILIESGFIDDSCNNSEILCRSKDGYRCGFVDNFYPSSKKHIIYLPDGTQIARSYDEFTDTETMYFSYESDEEGRDIYVVNVNKNKESLLEARTLNQVGFSL